MKSFQKKLNFLLVDDDVETVINIQQLFKTNKITDPLYTAKNGLEALEMLRTQEGKPPVISQESLLILLELNLPKMNGWEFLSELRSDPKLKVIPVIVLANCCDKDEKTLELYKLNVAGCITKPLAPLELAEMFMTIIKYWTINELP